MEDETVTEAMTPAQAATAFAQATRWQDVLVQRTEGLSWMIWGGATAGLLATMSAVGAADLPGWILLASWPPWLVMGYATTYVLWRTASIARPDLRAPSPWSYAGKSALVVALVVLLHFVLRPEGMGWPLALIGVAWLAVALLAPRLSPRGRRVALVAGVGIVASALVLAMLPLTMVGGMLLAAAVAGTVPVLAGFYQALLG